MKVKLVADCSANICENITLPVSYAPLKIITAEKEYVDTLELDVPEMLSDLKKYKGTSSTACPGTQDWIEAFDGSDIVFGVSLTSGISGCYNAAMIAAEEYMEKNPGTKVFILDSLSTGPELEVILERYQELINQGLPFEEICDSIKDYLTHSRLMFCLASVDNFIKNGRVNPLVGKALRLLDLKVVGRASDTGELETLNKCRGEKKALPQLFANMKTYGYKGGKVRIGHSYNLPLAQALEALIKSEFPDADVHITTNRGLCCYYAEEGSILVGFDDM